MAVPEQTPYIEHTGNGVTTSFSLGFQCESKDHLIVLVDEVEPPIATWSLSSGNIVFTTAPASGSKITLQRNTPFSRTVDYQSYNNSFRPPAVNKDFDWIWLKLQELGVADWILSNRIDALKNYVDDRDDELRAYLMEEIHKQGVALDQLDEYYNYLMQRLAQIAVDKGWSSDFVVTPQGETQQEVNDRGASYWREKPLGYKVNSRVMLDNGEIVKSKIPNNTNDPNGDMTGWVNVNDASQIPTLTALNQEMFNQKVERQTANHSVNLVDFLTRKQWKDWQEDNESLDFAVALETAFSTMYSSAPFLNGIRWGVGEIILPRGVIRLDLRQIQLNKAYGLIIRGQGAAATQIKTNRAAPTTPTELNDSLFRSEGYTYLELSDFSVTCTNQDINLIRLYGAGGGRELLMRNVTTQGFKHIKHIEGNTNTDTNYADRCTFGACKSVVYTRNNQAMVNTYLHCTFGVGIAKAFDVTGFGYTTFISCNAVTGGKFYHVASDGASFFGQAVTFINTKLEHNVDGKSQLLTSDNNPNVYIFAKFIGSGMVSADTPDANTYQIDVAGKLKIEIDGGEWNKCKFRFGQSIDYNTTVDIKNCSNPPSPTNISFFEYQAGYAYNYPSVNFKNNLNMMDLIVRHEKSAAANFSTQNCTSLRGAALLQAGSATPNTRTFDMKGQRCLVNSLDLYIKSWTSITNLRVSVFADAAFTVPVNTEQVIPVPTASGSTPLKANIPLTVQSFTDKLYVRITNDQLYGVVIGHFKMDAEFI